MTNTEFQYKLIFSMNNIQFVKSFSKGQITIPKELRNLLGIQNEFWLKLWIERGKIIAEPIEKKMDKSVWRKELLQITQMKISMDEMKRNKKQVEQQIKKRSL